MNISVNPKAKRLRNAKKTAGPARRSAATGPGLSLHKRMVDLTRVRRVFRDYGVITTNGSQVLPLTIFKNQDVENNASWSTIAIEFQQSRVEQMILTLFPCYNKAAAKSGADDYGVSFATAMRFWESVPTLIQNVSDAEKVETVYTDKAKVIETNFLGFETAKLFTSTNTATPASKYYGIAVGQPANITKFEASTSIYNYQIEFVVEFQGMK